MLFDKDQQIAFFPVVNQDHANGALDNVPLILHTKISELAGGAEAPSSFHLAAARAQLRDNPLP